MQNLNELRLLILKLSNGSEVRTDVRTTDGQTDAHTDGQREK